MSYYIFKFTVVCKSDAFTKDKMSQLSRLYNFSQNFIAPTNA